MPVRSVVPIGLRQRERTSLPPDRPDCACPSRNRRKRRFQSHGKPGAPSHRIEILTTDTGYSRGYDSNIDITSGYTQPTEVWFPQTPGIGDRNHPKHMVLRLLGEDTARAYPFSRL